MNASDQKFLSSLGFENQTGKFRWRVFCRGGRVLMIFPDDGKLLRAGIQLYSPQRWPARLAAKFLGCVPGARFFLRSIDLDLPESGAISRVIKRVPGEITGVLLGNPAQNERRGLILVQGSAQRSRVVKIGTSREARVQIRRELESLERHRNDCPSAIGIPNVFESWEESDFSAFSLPFYQTRTGSGERLAELIRVLQSWQARSKSSSFRSTRSWQQVEKELTSEEKSIAESLRLKPSLRHGDLALWNIVQNEDGGLIVIDWETALASDVPGWDLVHFLLTSSQFVEKNSPPETISKVSEQLLTDPRVQNFLSECGWQGNEGLLLRSYLLGRSDAFPDTAELLRYSRNLP